MAAKERKEHKKKKERTEFSIEPLAFAAKKGLFGLLWKYHGMIQTKTRHKSNPQPGMKRCCASGRLVSNQALKNSLIGKLLNGSCAKS